MTIRDIANAAGVSVATVSKVLNHRDQNISQETKERILQIIKDSGYVPYAKIRDRLLTGTNTIGLAVPSLDLSYYASFVSRVQALARQQGFALSLSITGGSSEEELAALESFRDTKAVGILFFPGSEEGLQALQQLHAEGHGAVILDYMMENAVCPQVFRANDRMAKQCTELLLDRCQRIALLTRRETGSIVRKAVCSGYEAALLEAHRSIDSGLEIHVGAEYEPVLDILLESGVDGIVCQDAELAGLVYSVAGKKRLQIPEDLSVISMEDAPLSTQLTPQLTSGGTSAARMAEVALEALSWQIRQQPQKFTSQAICGSTRMRGSISVRQKHTPRIAIIGSMNMDVVLQVPHLPHPGETLLAPQLTTWPGGKGANQALGVSRLGGNAYMFGCLGNDRYGKQIAEQLSSANVDMSSVPLTADQPTGTAYINVCPDGSNTIVVHPGANTLVDQGYIRRHQALLRSTDYCLIQMEIPFESVREALEFCVRHGTRSILKPSPARNLPEELLKGIYILVPNEEEAGILCPGLSSPEEQTAYFLDKGVENVIITMGPAGCLWANAEGIRRYPAHPFPCVDSTGASDVFISCLAVMLAEGKEIEDAIHAASWASSYSVAQEGVQNSIPERVLLDEFLQKT